MQVELKANGKTVQAEMTEEQAKNIGIGGGTTDRL